MKINNLHITLGVNYNIDYNLSEVYRSNQDSDTLTPIEWLQSELVQGVINSIYDDLKSIVRVNSHIHQVIYVRSRLLWLMYLNHCLGDIHDQIQTELSSCGGSK